VSSVKPSRLLAMARAYWLAEYPVSDLTPIIDELPDEEVFTADIADLPHGWLLYFDGSSASAPGKAGAGVVFITLDRHILPMSFQLDFPCSNNITRQNMKR
jgi:hypothetical protein